MQARAIETTRAPTHSTGGAPSPVATLSAPRLHEQAVEAFRGGNRGRLALCDALRMFQETRLYLELGFPSLKAYADASFHLRRAETFEHVRVSRSLADLQSLRQAFVRGQIGWSVVKAVTRVASTKSQSKWIAYAKSHPVESTLAEARDAIRRGSDTPRESTFGLPNLDQQLVLRFSRSDMAKVRAWLDSTCARIADSTGATEVAIEQAILFLCENQATPVDRGSRAPRAQVVYQQCPDCRRSRQQTDDGWIEVSPDEVSRYEGSAEPVVIDGPTPPSLRRKLRAREGGKCGNPRCRHRSDHCHHIVFRSRGGKTDLANEVAVCRTCHALIHAGLLRVRGRADNRLEWTPIGPNGAGKPTTSAAPDAARRVSSSQLRCDTPGRVAAPDTAESADADSTGVASGMPALEAASPRGAPASH